MDHYNFLSVYIIFMFSLLTIWYWVANWLALSWGRLWLPCSMPYLPIVLCIGLKLPELSSSHINMSTFVLVSLCLGSHVGKTLWV